MTKEYYHCYECERVYSDKGLTNKLFNHPSEIPEDNPRIYSFTHPHCFIAFKKRLEYEDAKRFAEEVLLKNEK